MEFDIKKFDEYKENNRLEVKKANGGLPHSLWESYSAMANCYGGVILLGVAENPDGSFTTSGLKSTEKLQKDLWDTINNVKKVSVNLLTDNDVETFDINGDSVLAIHVPRAGREYKPVYINDNLMSGTYRRNGEGDYHCTKSEIRAMLRDQTEETSDMKILDYMELSDLNADTIHAFRNRHNSYRTDHVWESLSDDDYLERIGAAKISRTDRRLHPTAAGLLMFGEEYRILYEFPEYFLDYREVLDSSLRWTDRFQSSSGDWTGNLFDFFFRVIPKLTKDLKVPFKLEGITRIDDTPVHRALREAVANCLVNTDFYIPRGIIIKKDDDKIVIENPGYIRTGKDQMLKGGISDPRNKALMKMFNMIGIGERAGSGVPDIYSVWASQNWAEPEVNEEYNPDRTILTLPFVKKQAEKASEFSEKQAEKTSGKSTGNRVKSRTGLKKNEDGIIRKSYTENKQKKQADLEKQAEKTSRKTEANKISILKYLSDKEERSASEIAEHLNLSGARVRALILELINENKIEKTGNGRSTRYYVR